jgi:hypothetical protein
VWVLWASGFVALASTPRVARAQGEVPWGPDRGSLAIGLVGVGDDRVRTRYGVWWYVTERVAVGVSGRLWGDQRVVQPEIHWTSLDWKGPAPFASLGVSAHREDGYSAVGFEASVGGELYLAEFFGISMAVAWRTTNWESPPEGRLGFVDERGFRTRATASVFPRWLR